MIQVWLKYYTIIYHISIFLICQIYFKKHRLSSPKPSKKNWSTGNDYPNFKFKYPTIHQHACELASQNFDSQTIQSWNTKCHYTPISTIWENPFTKSNTLCCSFCMTYIYMLVYLTRNFSLQHPSTSLPGSEERNFPHMPQSVLSSWTPTSSLHAVDHPAAHPC